MKPIGSILVAIVILWLADQAFSQGRYTDVLIQLASRWFGV